MRVTPTHVVASLGVLALATGGLAALVRLGSLAVHQCTADGAAGAIGLRLALLRHDPMCPSGTLAVGGDRQHVIGVLVLVALPVLLAHLAGAAAAVGVLARIRSGLRAVARVLAGLVARPEPTTAVVRREAGPVPALALAAPLDGPPVGMPLRRGPPLRLA
jgi:hypothetical protein